MAERITLQFNQAKTDTDFRGMVRELNSFDHPENVFHGLTVSQVLKRLLSEPLKLAHDQYVTKLTRKKGSRMSRKA